MISEILYSAFKGQTRHLSKDIDHFSIEKVGAKFYVYAHPLENKTNRKKIGTYPTYEAAKKAVDTVLDLKFAAKGGF